MFFPIQYKTIWTIKQPLALFWKNYGLETRVKLAVLCTYVENQAILEPIRLYRASKFKQTKEQASEDCLWSHIFSFLSDYYQLFFFFMLRLKQNKIKLCL